MDEEEALRAAMGFASFGRPRPRVARALTLAQLMPGTQLTAFAGPGTETGAHGVLYLVPQMQTSGHRALVRALQPQDGSQEVLSDDVRRDETRLPCAALLEELAREKRRFEALDSTRFLRARASTNAFEALGRHRFVNRSAMKLVTLDHIFRWTWQSRERMTSLSFVDICGGPGGFSEYLLWRMTQGDAAGDGAEALRAQGYGITLKDAANKCDWRVSRRPGTIFKTCYGADDTGNVYSLANIHCFRELVRQEQPYGVDLAVADGGFLEARSQVNQEARMTRLVLAEVLAMLAVLRVGGDFVCKTFEITTPAMRELAWLLHQCFAQLTIVKPVTSRPASSERYIVARGLHSALPMEALVAVLEDRLEKSNGVDCEEFSFLFLPNCQPMYEDTAFLKYVETANERFAACQIDACQRISDFAANKRKRKKQDADTRVNPAQYYQCWQLEDVLPPSP